MITTTSTGPLLSHIAWLHTRPYPIHMASCGLRLNDMSIRVAVGLQLGTRLRSARSYGTQVDACGAPLHGGSKGADAPKRPTIFTVRAMPARY